MTYRSILCAVIMLLGGLVGAAAPAQAGTDIAFEEKVCNQGLSALSCQVVGSSYVNSDPARAVEYFRRACDGGNMEGCRGLGILSAIGKGTGQDFQRAETLFRRACGGGDAPSCPLAERARADAQRAASTPAADPSPPVEERGPRQSADGAPVTPSGAPCEKVELVKKETGLGSNGYTKWEYRLSNAANCGRIGLTPKSGTHEYFERVLKPGDTIQFLCFHGLSHEPDCGDGLTGYAIRSME